MAVLAVWRGLVTQQPSDLRVLLHPLRSYAADSREVTTSMYLIAHVQGVHGRRCPFLAEQLARQQARQQARQREYSEKGGGRSGIRADTERHCKDLRIQMVNGQWSMADLPFRALAWGGGFESDSIAHVR
jgi:hypothetical protein